MSLTTHNVVSATQGKLVLGSPATAFTGVSIDSRNIRPGNLFFAIQGDRFDGHLFIEQACRNGATGVVVHRLDVPYQFPSSVPDVIQVPNTLKALQDLAQFKRMHSKARIIGITGSNGKTTTKEMLSSILQEAGKTLATKGNLNNHIGLPLTLMRMEDDDEFAVLEMGASMEGDIALLCAIARPDVGIIVNIGKAHLEQLKSPEGVLAVKRALFDSLSDDGIAVVNLDDPLLAPFANTLSCRKITYGFQPNADITADSIKANQVPSEFILVIQGKQFPATLPLPGQVQVSNALAAAAAACSLGLSGEFIVEGLKKFVPAAMRMQRLDHSSGALLINDAYNANPSSVRASIQTFGLLYADRPRWVVLGDMRELGDLARSEHRELGAWLKDQPIDRVFLYGRDTRFIVEGAQAVSHIERFRKKRDLIGELQKGLDQKPAILFKGSRRMRLEQVVNALQSSFPEAASGR